MAFAVCTDPGMDFSAVYRLTPRASFRREAFGGIIYHYEGKKPDPRMYFVPSPFLMGLLEMLDRAPLREVIDQAALRFDMSRQDVSVVEQFFFQLASNGAIAGESC